MIEWMEAEFCLEYVTNTTTVNYRWHQGSYMLSVFSMVVNYSWGPWVIFLCHCDVFYVRKTIFFLLLGHVIYK